MVILISTFMTLGLYAEEFYFSNAKLRHLEDYLTWSKLDENSVSLSCLHSGNSELIKESHKRNLVKFINKCVCQGEPFFLKSSSTCYCEEKVVDVLDKIAFSNCLRRRELYVNLFGKMVSPIRPPLSNVELSRIVSEGARLSNQKLSAPTELVDLISFGYNKYKGGAFLLDYHGEETYKLIQAPIKEKMGTLWDYGANRYFAFKEYSAVAKLNNRHIPRVYALFREVKRGRFHILYEHLKKINLSHKKNLRKKWVLQAGVDLAKLFQELNGRGIYHFNLTPDNVRMGNQSRVKVLNFSKPLMRRTFVHAPELAENEVFIDQQQVYSLGALLFYFYNEANHTASIYGSKKNHFYLNYEINFKALQKSEKDDLNQFLYSMVGPLQHRPNWNQIISRFESLLSDHRQ